METTLFNKNGKPVAYIADDAETIYLWDGQAVGYLFEDKVFGWNGKQLGWFANGTIFDIYGLRTGFIKSKSPIPTDIEPGKPAKQVKGARSVRQGAVAKPVMCYGYSGRSLEGILEEGSAL
jgi:4-fold beta-flower domain-containing protein